MPWKAVPVMRFVWTLATLFSLWSATAAFAQVPLSSHVVLVIDENHSFTEVQQNMTWLSNEGTQNGFATNYHSDNGGSLLDYLWLASGSCHSSANCTLPPNTHDFECTGNDCYEKPPKFPNPPPNTPDKITDDNIFHEMNLHGISWKVYAQSYTAAGGNVNALDNANNTSYYRRHNGATWYAEILDNVSNSQAKIVDFSQFATDRDNNTLPTFSIIVPDGAHDAHDCPNGAAACLQAADSFLNTNLTPLLAKPYFQPGGDGLLFVTFDECGGGTNAGCGAQVYTAVIGPKVIPHTMSSTPYKHENLLSTMLDALGLNVVLGAANHNSMLDFFGNTPPPPPPTGDLDDNAWVPCAGCAAAVNNVAGPSLDGASTRFDFNGAAFVTQKWTQALGSGFSSTHQFAFEFWAYMTNPAAPQAININAHQIVGGQEYPFMIQCDFKGSGFWRVWDPVAQNWTATTHGCAAFAANTWNHFVLHFERTTGNQLHWQDMVINDVTYTIDILKNPIANNSADSMTAEIHLVGDGVPDAYSVFFDQMRLMQVTPNLDDGAWTSCASPTCSPAVNNVASPALDGGSTQFTVGGTTAFPTGTWCIVPSGVNTSAHHLTLDFWAYMTNPGASQALNFNVDQITGGSEYPFMIQCDFKGSGFWRVWDPPTQTWKTTNNGCSVFTANSWNHITFRFERTAANQLHFMDMTINNVNYNIDLLANPISNTNPASVTVKVELVGDGVPDSYSLWIDEMSLANI